MSDFKLYALKKSIILLTLLTTAMLTSCSDETVEPKVAGRLVKTIEVGAAKKDNMRQYPGVVVANKKVDLAFQVPGQITKFPVLKGQKVNKGDLLAALDPRDYQIRLDELQATELQTKMDFLRAKELLEKATISKSQYDEKKANYDIAASQVKAAQKALDDASLIAPFTGLVANRYVENFQNVQAKEKILSLQDVSNIDIEINMPEQDVIFATKSAKEKRNFELNVSIEALPNREFPVSIKEYTTDVDPTTNTYEVTLTMPAPTDVNVLPGMAATLVLKAKALTSYYLIPIHAVLTAPDGQSYVYVVDVKTMQVQQRNVKVGQIINNQLQILEGLKAKEIIVINGVTQLTPNMKVRFWEDQLKVKS